MVTQTTPQLHRTSETVNLNVREGPSQRYDYGKDRNRFITDHITRYEVLSKYHTVQSGDEVIWWQIAFNNTTGWVHGDYVTLYNVDKTPVTWQPYTATLRTGSLALPFKNTLAEPNKEIPPIAITSLFDDPRRGPMGWDPEQRNLPIHRGIDWAMRNDNKVKHPVYAMAAGRVTNIVTGQPEKDKNAGYGNRVTVQSDGFRITYAHLAEVDQGLVNEYSNTETDNPRVAQGQRLGLPGQTGFSTGVHLHAHLEPDYITEIPTTHKHIRGAVNFQQYLPTGHYHWPDIAALQAEINAASESDRDDLGRVIDHWMDNILQGGVDPNKARLMVTPGRPVYMLPRVDENYAYPRRLFPGSAIVGMNQVMWDLFHSLMFTDAIPIPEWWRIQIHPSFPTCWVRNEDAEEIGDWRKARLASPSLLTDLPRYLQPAGINVRRTPNTHIRNNEGRLVADNNVAVTSRITNWVPITDLAYDATTGDYLWYQIPYDTANRASRGWVRGDVVTVKGDLLGGDENAFPDNEDNPENNIHPKVPLPADITPRASTGPDQKVGARIFPDRQSPAPRGFAGTTRITGIFKGITPLNQYTWYQLQLANARRGWVRADQVAVLHTNGLSAVQPRLRRWSGHTAAVSVRRGPADGETVRATIAADSVAWHNLLGRDAAHPGWWRIQYDDTVSGWVRADDAVETEGNLNSAPPPQVGPTDPPQACVVRSQPTATATELARIAADSTDRHPVLERDAAPAAWYRIRFSDTVTGWVSATCVRLHGDDRNLPVSAHRPRVSLKATVTDGLKVRSGPGTEHAWIGSIPGGSTVRYELLGKDADFPTWYWIRFSDTGTGWVYKDHLQTHGSLEDLEVTWIPQLRPKAATDTIETGGLNVHAGPGAHHRVLVTLPVDGTRYYDILGKDAAAVAWYQIRVSAHLTGWVPREYVQTRGPVANLIITWTPDPNTDTDPAAESGTSLNQASHHNSTYTLAFDGSTVTATFASSSSPVQYFARADQGRAPVFRILDPDLRPAEKVVLSTDTAREVNRDGSTKTGGLPRTLKLEVHTDGNVYYVDEGLRHIGYLDYSVTGTWTPAAAVPRERGTSLNQVSHRDSTYTLTVRDDAVHAVFASSSSPVQYYARADQGRASVFRIVDAALRPAAKTTLTVTDAQEVNQDGTPKAGGLVRALKLEVHTDGNVYYVDEGLRDIGYLSYRATGSWPLAPVEAPATPRPRPPATRPTLESGTSLNQVSHRGSTYTLTRSREGVAAVFVSTSSPVQYYARADQGRAPVFRIAAPALRPAAKVVLTTTNAQEVNQDGTPKTGGLVRTLKLEVHTNGEVYYVDEGLRRIGYLSYRVTGSWLPAAEEASTDTGTPPTETPAPAPSPQPTPTPAPARPTRERGTSLNQASHRGSTYTLNRSANTLTAAFASTSSPVQYFARADQGREPVFRIAAPALRPQAKVVLTTTRAREVDREGTLRPGATDRTLKLEVHTDGNVYYVDEGVRDIGYLKYSVTGSWPLAAPAPATRQLSLKATVTANLNVRSGPGTAHAIVGTITGGSTTRYDILGKDAATATWYQIQYSSTVTGWVHKDYVQTYGDLFGLTVTWVPPQLSLLATTTAGLNVRSGPGTAHSIVGTIAGGSTTRYGILGKDAATATWYQIQFSPTVTGWVHKDHVRTHGNLSGLTVTWNPPQLSLLATTTYNLNVRSGPGTSHGKVGFIPGGSTTRYDILGKDAATPVWWQIWFSSSVIGWVHGNYVQTHGDVSSVPVR